MVFIKGNHITKKTFCGVQTHQIVREDSKVMSQAALVSRMVAIMLMEDTMSDLTKSVAAVVINTLSNMPFAYKSNF